MKRVHENNLKFGLTLIKEIENIRICNVEKWENADGKMCSKVQYEFDDNSTNVFGDDAMKRFDFGLGLKAGVEFSQKYQISIGYDWGLVENIKDSGNKNRNLMISLSCFF